MQRLSAPAITATLLLAAATGQAATDLDALPQRLLDARTRPQALHELRQAGSDGARALARAFAAAGADEGPGAAAIAENLAAALAELGAQSHHVIDTLVAEVGSSVEPVRSHLLRAVATGALFATPRQRALVRAAARRWAAAGLVYSPAADAPTFAWYEYVRLIRRLRLAEHGPDAAGVRAAIQALRNERDVGIVFRDDQGRPMGGDHPWCTIESYGAHGQREQLEGIGELALGCDEPIADVLDELTAYLEQSPACPPRIVTEPSAGIGENAPNALPGARWPTRWRCDAWHFTCALAVLERHPRQEARAVAVRHLLHAEDRALRLRAIDAVRRWPGSQVVFADDLAASLAHPDRDVVREALVTIAAGPALRLPSLDGQLRLLTLGRDLELAAIARRLLEGR